VCQLRGGPLEIPGGGKEKCLEKKFMQPLLQRKKICASKLQSLDKKFVQSLNE
jgi:hypothetical protein